MVVDFEPAGCPLGLVGWKEFHNNAEQSSNLNIHLFKFSIPAEFQWKRRHPTQVFKPKSIQSLPPSGKYIEI